MEAESVHRGSGCKGQWHVVGHVASRGPAHSLVLESMGITTPANCVASNLVVAGVGTACHSRLWGMRSPFVLTPSFSVSDEVCTDRLAHFDWQKNGVVVYEYPRPVALANKYSYSIMAGQTKRKATGELEQRRMANR